MFGDTIRTYRCFLYNDDGELLSVGNGKGLGDQSLASAMFESIEHLFCTYPPDTDILYVPIHIVCSQDLLASEVVFEILLQKYPDSIIPCRRYQSVFGSEQIAYPVFLATPSYVNQPFLEDSFDYAIVSKYATNNGTAIGVNRTEALIHSISELIERDALSCFLLSTFVSRQPLPVRLIDKATLPPNLLQLIDQAESVMGIEITLIDICTDFQVPAILAVAASDVVPVPYVGSGASLSKSYACERAILETIQMFHLYSDGMIEEDIRVLNLFDQLPRYQACVRLDFADVAKESVSYENLPTYNVQDYSLHEYLSILVQRIHIKGYKAYYVPYFTSDLGTTCLHSVIPGLERFHLVRSGVPALPSRRGRKLLT
ncbi:YcaO-like family protein [Alicyclobacillus macrosporangiidus]|uniref:YcaO-like family protein n=1 Tax=Alicyclobacillus macrosporangiidus TaxID=392015 RepID=UPI0022B027A8|nr:YcaO-like family protein [Alicyclobacillus macrosporangiidus]